MCSSTRSTSCRTMLLPRHRGARQALSSMPCAFRRASERRSLAAGWGFALCIPRARAGFRGHRPDRGDASGRADHRAFHRLSRHDRLFQSGLFRPPRGPAPLRPRRGAGANVGEDMQAPFVAALEPRSPRTTTAPQGLAVPSRNSSRTGVTADFRGRLQAADCRLFPRPQVRHEGSRRGRRLVPPGRARRRRFRDRPLAEFKLTTPRTNIPDDAPALRMNVQGRAEPICLTPSRSDPRKEASVDRFDPPGFLDDFTSGKGAWSADRLGVAGSCARRQTRQRTTARGRNSSMRYKPAGGDGQVAVIAWNAFPRQVKANSLSDTQRWRRADADRNVRTSTANGASLATRRHARSPGSTSPARDRSTGRFSPR